MRPVIIHSVHVLSNMLSQIIKWVYGIYFGIIAVAGILHACNAHAIRAAPSCVLVVLCLHFTIGLIEAVADPQKMKTRYNGGVGGFNAVTDILLLMGLVFSGLWLGSVWDGSSESRTMVWAALSLHNASVGNLGCFWIRSLETKRPATERILM